MNILSIYLQGLRSLEFLGIALFLLRIDYELSQRLVFRIPHSEIHPEIIEERVAAKKVQRGLFFRIFHYANRDLSSAFDVFPVEMKSDLAFYILLGIVGDAFQRHFAFFERVYRNIEPGLGHIVSYDGIIRSGVEEHLCGEFFSVVFQYHAQHRPENDGPCFRLDRFERERISLDGNHLAYQ
jgi:hypothetical protein